jgi:hypothetical protein
MKGGAKMNELAVAIAIVLFPGLIATVIIDKVVVHMKPWSTFKYSIYSFVFGVFCYGALQAFLSVIGALASLVFPHFDMSLSVWSLIDASHPPLRIGEVFGATLFAPLVAYLAALVANYKLLNRIAQKIRVSDKYGDENLFSYYLNSKDIDWIYVRDIGNNLTYEGRLQSFSETPSIQELVLYDVTLYRYEDSTMLYSIPTLYLCRSLGSLVIEQVPNQFFEVSNGVQAKTIE